MNANDLPESARLAGLIEAGVAANPDLRKNNREDSIDLLNGKHACSIGFACLGAGMSRKELSALGCNMEPAAKFLGISEDLCGNTAYFNDTKAENIGQVVELLRAGSMPKIW